MSNTVLKPVVEDTKHSKQVKTSTSWPCMCSVMLLFSYTHVAVVLHSVGWSVPVRSCCDGNDYLLP